MATAPDFSKYADPVPKASAGPAPDFSKYGDQISAPKPTMGQRVGAAAEAGGRAALQGAGVLAGAGSGATLGSTFGPVGTVAGGLIGGYLGYQAGDLAAEGGLGLRSAQQMPPELRTSGVFGESVGGAIPFAAAPYAAGAAGLRATERAVGEIGYSGASSAVGRFLNSIVEMVRRRPVVSGIAEAATATSAGGGAALAESIRPGDQGFRSGVETIAGAANPTALAIGATTKAMSTVRSALQRLSPSGAQTDAARVLQALITQTGEDPALLARALRAAGAPDELSGLTAAQRTGSPALAALQQHLGRINKQFGAEAEAAARDGLDAIRMLIGQLQRTGDPAALAAAAELRGDYYRTILSQAVETARAEAVTRAGRVGRGNTTADRENISNIARETLDQVIADARAVETDLWSKVDGTRRVETSNLQQTYNQIVAETLPELRGKKLPAVVRNFLERVTQPRKAEFDYDPVTMSVKPMETAASGTNAGEMRKLRSELLALARAASRDPDQAGMERIYSDLAEATMDDMDAAFKAAGDRAYDEARQFTREMNDTFTRSFVGRATGTGKYGDRVAPEVLLQKALSTGRQAGSLRLQELAEATRFLNQRGFADDSAYRTMMGAQDQVLRIAAAESVDPKTGVVDPEKVRTFVKNNVELMRRFPEVAEDLRAAASSATRLRALTNRAQGVQDILDAQGAFGVAMGANARSVTGKADAAMKAAERVLVRADQEAELDRLVNIAQGGAAGRTGRVKMDTPKAMEGLSKALINAAMNKATATDGALNIAQFRDMMTRPVERGQKPLLQLMQEKGLIDPKTAKNMENLFKVEATINEAQNPRTAVQVKESATSQVMTMLARIAGSKAVGMTQAATGSGGGSSIIVHGAAARFADEFMNKLPIASANKVLTEAMFDPEKMALLLTKMDDSPEAARAARRVHAWLVQSALLRDPEQDKP